MTQLVLECEHKNRHSCDYLMLQLLWVCNKLPRVSVVLNGPLCSKIPVDWAFGQAQQGGLSLLCEPTEREAQRLEL